MVDELEQRLAVGLEFQVQRDTFLDAIDAGEVGALSVLEERSEGASVVSSIGPLDLDHLGTQVGQQQRAIGACQHAGQVQDPQA